MKILHVVEPFSSGIVTFIINITKSQPDNEHVIFHGKRTTNDKIKSVRNRFPKGVKFFVWRNVVRSINPIKDIRAGIELYRFLSSNKFDAIHLHSSKAGFIGRLVGRILGLTNIIYTPNGASFLRQDINYISKRVYSQLELIASKFSGKVVCCGKSESDAFNTIGVKNSYINNGIELTENVNTVINSPLIIGTVGIITEQKNPRLFFEIVEHFKNDKRIFFKWIGDGEKQNIKYDFNNVTITGWLSEQELKDELIQLDLYLSTSLWEGQPFAVIEAMNYGKCLVLNKCVGNIDLVTNEENGYLFETKDEAINVITNLIESPAKIQAMGVNSKKRCESNHNFKTMGDLYNKVYESIAVKN
ncbi:glycosyltransferase [Fulvivirga lutea]|uniref:Glycosyltransferase n=1 Tax=Fulvivirga lutea TaxID=2810512 RepID=A0A974WH27_9BACT|nr:glycosyltransferase [Fulvivirga lutea]QSE98398.1 glycosyltransferase [Fulvivirga lutea]